MPRAKDSARDLQERESIRNTTRRPSHFLEGDSMNATPCLKGKRGPTIALLLNWLLQSKHLALFCIELFLGKNAHIQEFLQFLEHLKLLIK